VREEEVAEIVSFADEGPEERNPKGLFVVRAWQAVP